MKKIYLKTLNYLKSLTAETISNARSGHTGSALGGSSILLSLFLDHLNYDVSDPDFLNRDRFVMSAGHASALYYSLMAMFGYDVSLQDLKEFRTLGSKTCGHPEFKKLSAIEATTGPLGEGVACAVGMAIAESVMEERFNAIGFPIINNFTYCYAGDGDLQEGVAMEACSLAGALNLKRFILLYDANDVTMDGSLSLSSRENVIKKFKSIGFNVIEVFNGNSYPDCSRAIARAKRAEKPTIIVFHTTIGIGTEKEGTSAIHGHPLTAEELAAFKSKLGVSESFYIPSDVREFCMASTIRCKLEHERWNQTLAVYATSHPELFKSLVSFFDVKKIDYERLAISEKLADLSMAQMNEVILNEVADKLPQVIGGTADVLLSTRAFLQTGRDYLAGDKRGRNIHFGLREHAMAGICNGISLYEDFLPFDSTFLAFSNYMIPALRLRAMMKLPVLDIFTHDSVLIGQDGATHQPIEQISMLRKIKDLYVFRPCDANELVSAYKFYLTMALPTSIVLAKQKIEPNKYSQIKKAMCGGYVMKSAKKQAEIVIMASGSEVPLALNVASELEKSHEVSVVSMPCIELFEEQSSTYKEKVLQPAARLHVCIEASNCDKWRRFLKPTDVRISVEDYQGSGDGEKIYSSLGFNVKQIVRQITKSLKN